jgi:hypothetical protein
MEDYDTDAAFAQRLIDFDADDPATYLASGQQSAISIQPEAKSEANTAMRAAAVKAIP